MAFVRGMWKILVGIKDLLVLALLVLFFALIFAALSASPNRAVAPGALVLKLDGSIVEQPAEVDPFQSLSGSNPTREYRLRDLLRALDAAARDDRVKAVVLDLEGFTGGYPASLIETGRAIRRVRDAGKPVLAFSVGYTDSTYMLAANASEIWMDPMGAVLPRGFGGSNLYFKGLVDRLGVNARVYRVGTYKAAVEPFIRADQSPEAREANQALYGAIFEQWKDELKRARPIAMIDAGYANPFAFVRAQGGDAARASLAGRFVDKLADRTQFTKRVAQVAGADPRGRNGEYAAIRLADWVAANPLKTDGPAIGVVTVAGTIVDGDAPAGTAGGDTIARALMRGLDNRDLKAIVLRVDSPGGSALASERIRVALLEAKRRGLPVVVSMGGLAASGGYWVSTPGDVIFAEPSTITGSIGVFGIIPTFENTLAKIGVTTDGVRTTPLSGQPDVLAGTNAETDAMIQSSVEDIYAKFLARVSASRRLPVARVNQIGQGRVWDGGTARQLGLVDRFGGLKDAIDEAARRAQLAPGAVRAVYLEKEPSWQAQLLQMYADQEREERNAGEQAGLVGMVAAQQRAVLTRALGDAKLLLTAGGVQARCIECVGYGPAAPQSPGDARLIDLLIAKLGL